MLHRILCFYTHCDQCFALTFTHIHTRAHVMLLYSFLTFCIFPIFFSDNVVEETAN